MPKLTKDNQISLYTDKKPERTDYEQAVSRLSIAFPRMKGEFFILLTEFLIKENFTKKRLTDAVNHIIANFQYKELNISDIIQFDRKIKLYTYNEVTEMVLKHQASYSDFEIREIDGKKFRVKKTDLII